MLHEHLAAWSAKVLGKKKSFGLGVIDALWAQRYAVSVDDLDPLYFDEAYAREHGYEGHHRAAELPGDLKQDNQDAGPPKAELLADGTRPDGRPDIPGLQIMGGRHARGSRARLLRSRRPSRKKHRANRYRKAAGARW